MNLSVFFRQKNHYHYDKLLISWTEISKVDLVNAQVKTVTTKISILVGINRFWNLGDISWWHLKKRDLSLRGLFNFPKESSFLKSFDRICPQDFWPFRIYGLIKICKLNTPLIEPKIDNILMVNQNDFRRNRSTTSQILIIRRILEGERVKKPTGDNTICRLYQSALFHSQREGGTNPTSIRPIKRDRRSNNDSL